TNKKRSYPQSAYPNQQQASAQGYPPTMQVPRAPAYTDAPPSYSEIYQPRYMHPSSSTVPQLSSTYPANTMYIPMAQTVPVAPVAPSMPMGYYSMGPSFPPGSTLVVGGAYDPGARFGAGATANIPPPPPGCPPTMAQLAAMQNVNVVMTPRKGSYFTGGSDGGYSIW
uniref:DAZ-associated protein 2 n=1 Tax=Latimeria chalumnae TaxID=7897 RepID=H3AZX9_LATCH